MKKIIILCLAFLFYAGSAFAKFDPAFTWTTLETPHFSIHYHQGEEELAKRTAVIAEDVHARLVPRIQWEPTGRTHLVLVDAMDATNGLTTVVPYRHITLYITPPVGAPGFGTTVYDEWMRTLITHEYAHILHLDMVHGVPDFLQYLFGRLYFPNQFQPTWMIEGLATYEETEQTSGGRGRSPGAEMVIRMAVLEDKFPRLSQAAVFPDFWPSGQVPYLFGEGFTRFIAEKYGREKLANISTRYSYYGVPWFVDANGRWTLGAWYSDLWYEWQNGLKARYAKIREELSATGLTASLALTRRGFVNISPVFSPDGNRVAYTVSNEDEFPAINIMNADGTEDRRLVENTTSSTSSGKSIAWSPDGSGIYYTKIDISRNTNIYNDIYYYDVKEDEEIRITDGLRARDPFPSPDGKRLLFVSNKLGRTRLGIIDIPNDLSSPVLEKDINWLSEESANQYETPRYSPDGTLIVVGVWQPGGYKDIWVLDKQGNKVEELTHDRAIDGNAAWSPDGKVIYFSSDRTGIFNLYAFERATKKIYRITNVLGGAFTPAPSPDGKTLVFSSYSSAGYDIHMRPADSASWKPAEPDQDRYPEVAYTEKPVETRTHAYNPLPTLVPRYWFPWFGFSEESRWLFGFLTSGQDAVERHSYALAGFYSPKTYRKWYAFNYVYDGLYPTFQFAASDMDGTFSDLLSDPTGTKDYVQRERAIDASLVFPLLKLQKQHALLVGYRRKEISALTRLPPWPRYSGPVPAQGTLVSGRAVYLFNNAKQYGFSISPEGGRTIEVGYKQYDKSIGSDFNISKYSADWHEYIDFPWKHHVLQARAFAGISRGEVIPQGAFQVGGDNPGNALIPVDDESIYLRGYPINSFRGRKAGLASLEYRFPIKDIELGWSSTPVFLRRVHGAVFAEAGNAWNDAFRSREFKRSAGAEVRLDTNLTYYLPITFRIVFAYGFDDKGESQVYVSLWMPALF
ncbi:MAG: BamA/TamA family outer membrane protein [Nitrospirae bacterium]|nr:BamA/TamA family outer membrane protein [Nitrospirota bacterium]